MNVTGGGADSAIRCPKTRLESGVPRRKSGSAECAINRKVPAIISVGYQLIYVFEEPSRLRVSIRCVEDRPSLRQPFECVVHKRIRDAAVRLTLEHLDGHLTSRPAAIVEHALEATYHILVHIPLGSDAAEDPRAVGRAPNCVGVRPAHRSRASLLLESKPGLVVPRD